MPVLADYADCGNQGQTHHPAGKHSPNRALSVVLCVIVRLVMYNSEIWKGYNMKVKYEVFRGTLATWETLFRQASEFAATLGRERVINISHSCDHSDGVVTVWYWE